jgi:hypothetical protein
VSDTPLSFVSLSSAASTRSDLVGVADDDRGVLGIPPSTILE